MPVCSPIPIIFEPAVHGRALRAVEPRICLVDARQLLDDGREFLLQDLDAVADDVVGREAADGLDVEEEAVRHGVVVEGFVGLFVAAVEFDAGFVDGPGRIISVCCDRNSSA